MASLSLETTTALITARLVSGNWRSGRKRPMPMSDSIFTDKATAEYVKGCGKQSKYPTILFVERPTRDLLTENYHLFVSGAPKWWVWERIREKSRGGVLPSDLETEKESS